MGKKLRIGMIGCGGIAKGKHMPALSRLEGVELVAFSDVFEQSARDAAKQFGAADAKVYTDYHLLLQDPSIDVVHICTPNDTHADIAIAALQAGKHVNCEKPMAKTAADAQKMYDVAQKSDKKLTISYQNRFRPDSQYLYKAIQDGELGEIYFAKAHALRRRAVPTWGVFLDEEKQGGGPLIDIGTHALDLALWMMNNYEPKIVLGKAYHKLSQKENAANAWGPWDPEKFTVEDSAFGMIQMKNGATVILESSWALNTLDVDEAKCSLSGTEGGADMKNGLTINGEKYGKLHTKHIQTDGKGVAFFEETTERAEDLEMQLWYECIVNDTEPVVTPKQALVVSQILEAIYESSRKGEAITFT